MAEMRVENLEGKADWNLQKSVEMSVKLTEMEGEGTYISAFRWL